MKKPKMRYDQPQLWVVNIYNFINGKNYQRFRILYPNGTAEYANEDELHLVKTGWYKPCWLYFSNRTMKNMIAAMHAHDKDVGNPKAVFIGNI